MDERKAEMEGQILKKEAAESMERYWMWLCSCPGIYRNGILALMQYFRSPKAVYEADVRDFIAWQKLPDDRSLSWVASFMDYREKVCALQAEEILKSRNLSFVSRQSKRFPKKLRDLPDCPYGLFYRGRLPDEDVPSVAVVGARLCSRYGVSMAEMTGKALTRGGYQVISGMAAGIDSAAQDACVKNGGSSFALLGCGADVCYPSESGRLYEALPERGGVISEFPPGTPPLRAHFPLRNRLISGLSDAVIVVEARDRSGSLITADLALDQGREVWAVPGRYSDPLSFGCNRLISQGAGIVYSADSLIDDLDMALDMKRGPEKKRRAKGAESEVLKDLDENEMKVYRALGYEARGVDEISRSCSLTLLQTMTALLGLQMKGFALESSKNRFVIKLAS